MVKKMYNRNGFEDIESGKDIFSDKKNISSRSYSDISSKSNRYDDDIDIDIPMYHGRSAVKEPIEPPPPPPAKRTKKKKKRKKHLFLKIFALTLCSLILITAISGFLFYRYAYNLIDEIKRVPLDTSDLGITTSYYTGYKNIALLGLDTREDDKSGRSDANLVITIDKTNKKIKLTSIARDSYVAIDGHSNDKLTHAYAFGKTQLAVKTLNQNFGVEITDYINVNFFELAHIIDFLGGVEIEVDAEELPELNRIIRKTDFGDMPNPRVGKPGIHKLTGTQAVCYARIRKIDGDVERGNRQKEVISAMFTEIKKVSIFKLPKLASMLLSECETSLSTDDIMELGLWAVFNSPKFEQLSIPNDNVNGTGSIISGVWYYTYDIEKARQEIKDFIFEENYYSPENAAERKKAESKTK